MKNLFQKFQFQICLVFIGFLWIFILNFLLQISLQNYVYPDTESYIRASEDLYFSYKPNDIRPSLIALINGFPLLFGFSKTTLFLWNSSVNLVFWFANVLLIFGLSSKIISKKAAFFIALIYLFTLGSLLIVFEFLSETVFSFFLLVSFFLFRKYTENKKVTYLCLGFSTLILSMLIKPVSLLLFFFVCVFFGLKELNKVIRSRSSILVYSSIFMVLCHLYSMKSNYGNYTLSYIDSFTYYNYLGTRADCFKNGTKFVQCNNYRYRYFNKFSLSDTKKVAFEDVKNQLTNNTFNFAKAYCTNLFLNSCRASGYFYAYQNKTNSVHFEIYRVLFRGFSRLQSMLYSFIGFIVSLYYFFRKKTDKFLKTTSFAIIYIVAMSAISSDQADRFYIVIYPLILILLAQFLKDNFKSISVPLQK